MEWMHEFCVICCKAAAQSDLNAGCDRLLDSKNRSFGQTTEVWSTRSTVTELKMNW